MSSRDLNTYGLSTKEVQEILDAFATEAFCKVLREHINIPGSTLVVPNSYELEWLSNTAYEHRRLTS